MSVESLHLATMMGTYPKTTPLKDGTVTSPLLKLDFADVEVAQKAFKDVVRNLKFEVAEIAIVTFLQAFDAGKPFVLLPFVMTADSTTRASGPGRLDVAAADLNGQDHRNALLLADDFRPGYAEY